MNLIPDAPDIANALRTGYPTVSPLRIPICPICHKEPEQLYKAIEGDIIGCDWCITTIDVDDYDEYDY